MNLFDRLAAEAMHGQEGFVPIQAVVEKPILSGKLSKILHFGTIWRSKQLSWDAVSSRVCRGTNKSLNFGWGEHHARCVPVNRLKPRFADGRCPDTVSFVWRLLTTYRYPTKYGYAERRRQSS
jgi:hypothetical protein